MKMEALAVQKYTVRMSKISKSAAIRRLLYHDSETPPKVIRDTLRTKEGIEVDENLIKVVRRNWRRLSPRERASRALVDGKFPWQEDTPAWQMLKDHSGACEMLGNGRFRPLYTPRRPPMQTLPSLPDEDDDNPMPDLAALKRRR